MKWINLFSATWWKQKFDWTPVAVKTPRPRYEEYKDVGRTLLGYEVEVEYLYHGVQRTLFSTDTEKFCFVTPQKALANAIRFYKETKSKVAQYKKEQQNAYKR